MNSYNQYINKSDSIRNQIRDVHNKALYILPFWRDSFKTEDGIKLPNGSIRVSVKTYPNFSLLNSEVHRFCEAIIRLGEELEMLKKAEVEKIQDEIENIEIELQNHDDFYISIANISSETELWGDVDRYGLSDKLKKLKTALDELNADEPVKELIDKAHGLFLI